MAIRRVILVWLVPEATDAERADLARRLGGELVRCAGESVASSRDAIEAGVKRDPRAGFDVFAVARFADEAEVDRFDRAAVGVVARVCGDRLGGCKQYDFATVGFQGGGNE